MSENETCEICEAPFAHESLDFDYTGLAGLDPEFHRITLVSIDTLRCKCGITPRIPNVDGLHYTIGLALIRSESLLDGRAVKFLRKTLGMTQVKFVRDWISPQYYSNWERGIDLPAKQTQIAAALTFLATLAQRPDAISVTNRNDLVDTMQRVVSKSRELLKPTTAELRVDITSAPPAWQIEEMKGPGGSTIAGGI